MKETSPELSERELKLIRKVSKLYSGRSLQAALEKDLHLSKVLTAIHQAGLFENTLVFAGGTSLVKCYGMPFRLSEDLDLKILPSATLSKSQNRKRLGTIRSEVSRAIEEAGYRIQMVKSRAENSYHVLEVLYPSIFPISHGLRSFIKLELKESNVFSPPESQSVKNFISEIELDLKVPCVRLEQTLVEKLIALLRQFHPELADREVDPRSVRHLFDIYSISRADLQKELLLETYMWLAKTDTAFKRNETLFALTGKDVDSLIQKIIESPGIQDSYAEFAESLTTTNTIELVVALERVRQIAQELVDTGEKSENS